MCCKEIKIKAFEKSDYQQINIKNLNIRYKFVIERTNIKNLNVVITYANKYILKFYLKLFYVLKFFHVGSIMCVARMYSCIHLCIIYVCAALDVFSGYVYLLSLLAVNIAYVQKNCTRVR